MYSLLKTIHILAVVVWVGGGVTTNILGSRIRRSNDTARLVAFARDSEWVGQRVYLPASVTVLVFGVLAVLEGNWSFGDPWVGIGFAGIIITALTGSLFFGPETRRIRELAESRGGDDAEVRRRLDRLITIGRVDILILVLVIFDMVFKPGL